MVESVALRWPVEVAPFCVQAQSEAARTEKMWGGSNPTSAGIESIQDSGGGCEVAFVAMAARVANALLRCIDMVLEANVRSSSIVYLHGNKTYLIEY